MDKVARLPAEQRGDLFSETAGKMNLRPALIEKDFWVCWTLKRLFSLPEFESRLLFKGGTTLSKIFGINYHPQSGWFDEGPSKGPPPCGRGLKPPEVLLLLAFFLIFLVSDVVPNDGLV